MRFDVRLVAYEPFGPRIGELPQATKHSTADPLSDTPSMRVTYSPHAIGSEILQRPVEVAQEVYNPHDGTWFEPPNNRFLSIRGEGDTLEPEGTTEYVMPGYAWLLSKVLVFPTPKAQVEGQIEDARKSELEARNALNLAEDNLAVLLGLKKDTNVVFSTTSPESTKNIWVDTSNPKQPVTRLYVNNAWRSRGSATISNNALAAYSRHSDMQEQLRDAEGRSKRTKRVFTNRHPGAIIAELLAEARQRGDRLTGLTSNFNNAGDSAGNAWPPFVGTIEVNVGSSLLSLMQSFVAAGSIDFHTNKRALRVFLQNTELSRQLEQNVVLRYGYHIDEAPDRSTLEGLASQVLFLGDDGLSFTRSNAEAPRPWGEWETSVSQTGVETEAAGSRLASNALAEASGPRIERTRGLMFKNNLQGPLPYITYRPGDYLSAPKADGRQDRQRVQQITLAKDGKTGLVTGNLILNDRFIEREIRNSRTTQALMGGTSSLGGSGASPRQEVYVDRRTPERPRSIGATAVAGYVPGSGYQAYVDIEWWWSNKATNGTSMADTIARFEVQYRPQDSNFWRPNLTTTVYGWRSAGVTSGDNSSLTFGPVDGWNTRTKKPMVYELRVRAVAVNGRGSSWSTVGLVTVELDRVPPAKPSRPGAAAQGSVVHVTWNGKNADGGATPPDFSMATIHGARVPEDAPTDAKGIVTEAFLHTLNYAPIGDYAFGRAGSIPITEIPHGQLWAFRLQSIDATGNLSPLSDASVPVATSPLVDGARLTTALEEARAQVDADQAALVQQLAGLDSSVSDAKQSLRALEDFDATINDAWVENLATKQITSSKINVSQLTAIDGMFDQAVVDQLWVQKIASQKITANEVMVGRGPNLVVNGYGEMQDATNWPEFTADLDSYEINNAAGVAASLKTMNRQGIMLPDSILVAGGKAYALSVKQMGDNEGQRGYVQVRFFDATGLQVGSTYPVDNAVAATGGEWSTHTGMAVAPATASSAKITVYSNHTNGTWATGQWHRWAALDFREATDGRLIVDGSISTNHIDANTFDVTKLLRANSIEAQYLRVDQIKNAVRIDSRIFSGQVYYGGSFVGGAFFTEGTPKQGRVAINSEGLWCIDPAGKVVMHYSNTTGALDVVGRFRTGEYGQRGITISSANSSWNNVEQGVWFTMDGNAYGWYDPGEAGAESTVAGMWQSGTDPTYAKYALRLRGHGTYSVVRVYRTLEINTQPNTSIDHQNQVGAYPNLSIRGTRAGVVRTDGTLHLQAGSPTTDKGAWGGAHKVDGDIEIYSGTGYSHIKNYAAHSIYLEVGARDAGGPAGAGGIYFKSSGWQRYNQPGSTGGTLRITTTGRITEDLSSRKWKTDIEAAAPDERIFDIQPVTYREKLEIERAEDLSTTMGPLNEEQHNELLDAEIGSRTLFGAIAEDIEGLGLKELVNYDINGDPASLRYEVMALKLLPFVKELWQFKKDYEADAAELKQLLPQLRDLVAQSPPA